MTPITELITHKVIDSGTNISNPVIKYFRSIALRSYSVEEVGVVVLLFVLVDVVAESDLLESAGLVLDTGVDGDAGGVADEPPLKSVAYQPEPFN